MKNKDIYDDISSIKTIMERSSKFISLSGLSGVLAGVYALIGAGIAYTVLPPYNNVITDYQSAQTAVFYSYPKGLDLVLFAIAIGVLLVSIGTGILLSAQKAKRNNQAVWNQSSRALLNAGLFPLVTGGCFAFILYIGHHYGAIAPTCLVFYGLALVSASQFTYGDVKWLGILEIILGLLALMQPGYGLYFWALGFGVLHVLYGAIMYFKYDRVNA
ncbi:hypothetical protein [Mucilaginibacter sp. dw_454]|uniref:hypothetical protein n=1 Tax=Mucilaginibacter sp. dw_454 TaxID=2720079 RepID=UPI001BD50AA0|nr:hypothetical protein [Mucilaginibacter sp. dw_454]